MRQTEYSLRYTCRECGQPLREELVPDFDLDDRPLLLIAGFCDSCELVFGPLDYD